VAFLAADSPKAWAEHQAGHWFQVQHEPSLRTRFELWSGAMQKELSRYNSVK